MLTQIAGILHLQKQYSDILEYYECFFSIRNVMPPCKYALLYLNKPPVYHGVRMCVREIVYVCALYLYILERG